MKETITIHADWHNDIRFQNAEGHAVEMDAEIAWQQIRRGDKMACGAREAQAIGFTGLSGSYGKTRGLRFKVLNGRKFIEVTLAPSDTYIVRLVRLRTNRKTWETTRTVIEEHGNIYAEELSDTIYHACNK
jgi:hypothetical protein